MKFENNQKPPSPEELKKMEGYIKKEIIEGRKPEYIEDDPASISPDEMRIQGVIKREAARTRKRVQNFTRTYSPVERRQQAQELMKLPKDQRKDKLETFYQKQQIIMEEFEGSLDQRNVKEIMREKKILFLHGIPIDNLENATDESKKDGTTGNNEFFHVRSLDSLTLAKTVIGFSPTISACISKIEDKKPVIFYKFGFILGKGKITIAHNQDAATLAENLYSRRVRKLFDKEQEVDDWFFKKCPDDMRTHSIQGNISKNIQNAIDNPQASAATASKSEIVIEKPEVLGFYVDFNNNINREELIKIIKIAREINLPIFGLQNGNIFQLKEEGRKDVNIQEIQKSTPQISNRQKLQYIDEIIRANAFVDSKVPKEAKKRIEGLKSKAENTSSENATAYGNYPDFLYLEDQRLMFYNAELMLNGNHWQYPKANNGNELVNSFVEMGVKEPSMSKIREMFQNKTFEECQALVNNFNQQKKESDDLLIEWRYPDVQIDDQILHTLQEKYSDLQLDSGSLETILQKSNFDPKELVNFMKEYFCENYDSDAGVWEKYTIEEHTVMVMNQFEKYFKDINLPANLDANFFRLFLSLHYIGKKDAIEQEDKGKQHEHTLAYVELIFENLGRSEKEKNIALALLSSDPIGKYLKRLSQGYSQEKEIPDVVGYITKMAKKAQIPRRDFFELLLLFYKVDASSYTEDSGGKKSLDHLFDFSDKENLQFSPDIEKKIDAIRKEISK